MESERIISRKEFRELTGLSRSSEWRLGNKGKLPPIVKMSESWVLGYRYSDFVAWLDERSYTHGGK